MNTVKPSTRVLWLDQLRAIGMFFVVLGHVALPKQYNMYIYAFHMPLFFMISGMTHRVGKYQTLVSCMLDKGKKLLLPYYFMNLVMLPVWIVNFKLLTNADPTLVELFQGMLFIHSDQYQTPTNATWFLASLFIVEVLIYSIERITKNNKERMGIRIVLCAFVSYMESINGLNYAMPWHIDAAFSGIVFYYAGYLFMQYRNKICDYLKKTKIQYYIVIVLCLAVGWYLSRLNGRVSMNGNVQKSFLYFYGSAFAFSLAIILLVMKLPISRFLSYIGRNTIIYLGFHIPMIRFIEHNLELRGGTTEGWIAFTIAVVVYIVMTVVVAYVNNFVPFIVMKPYKENRKNKLSYAIAIATVLGYVIVTVLVIGEAIQWGRLKLYR